MGIDVPTVLDALLEATAQEAAAKARIASLRASLEEEARRRFQSERAAPSWNAPELGKVRFDPPGRWEAMVAEHDAFGSWAAEHYPTEVTGVIRLPAALLEEALMAIGFALGEHGQPNTVTSSLEVRPAWSSTFLSGLTVDVEEVATDDETMAPDRTFTVTDDHGQLVDGVTGTRSAAKLVVSLDRDRRTAAVESARAAAGALIEVAQTDDGPAIDAQELDERRRYLEGLHGDVLAAYAGRLELGKSGTKAELAERVARAEAITGRRELIPATDVVAPVDLEAELVKGLEDGAAQSAQEEAESGAAWEAQVAELEGLGSREVLRQLAKNRGLSASGTKTQVAARLAGAGVTPNDVRLMAATQETT